MYAGKFMSAKEYARFLRKNLTPEEAVIWRLLRNRKLNGYKFLRQHPIKVWETDGHYHYYFADFYCSDKRLVVEIDGLIHTLQDEYDRARDFVMQELGYKILRIKNEEVNNDLAVVIKRITQALDSSPNPFSIP